MPCTGLIAETAEIADRAPVPTETHAGSEQALAARRARIRAMLAELPPLTDAQLQKIAILLRRSTEERAS